jgi:TRAP-type C4-dicarboxylate transport system permease small subunit
VLSQGPLVLVIVLLPFWYRKRAAERPRWMYRAGVTAVLLSFLGLTIWGGWHEEMIDGEERLIPLTHYLREQPMTFIFIAVTLLVFYLLMWQERRAIRRVMDAPAPEAASHQEGRP